MIVSRAEMVHAMNHYFKEHVRDEGLRPYATVTDVCEIDNDLFEIALEGRSVAEET